MTGLEKGVNLALSQMPLTLFLLTGVEAPLGPLLIEWDAVPAPPIFISCLLLIESPKYYTYKAVFAHTKVL